MVEEQDERETICDSVVRERSLKHSKLMPLLSTIVQSKKTIDVPNLFFRIPLSKDVDYLWKCATPTIGVSILFINILLFQFQLFYFSFSLYFFQTKLSSQVSILYFDIWNF